MQKARYHQWANRVASGERPQLNNNLLEEVSDLLKRCWHADASKRPAIDYILQFYCNKESTVSKKQTILLSGGDSYNKALDTLLLLENNGQNWKQLNIKLPYAMYSHGSQFLNNNLYIFGGRAVLKSFNSTYKLSKSLQWEKMADMNQKRSEISNSSVILNNQIWACGGWTREEKELKSVEMYDPLTNKWKYMKEMNERRLYAGAAVINGKIFCSGGYNGKDSLNSVECYDPFSDVWTLISNMPQKIWGHGAVEIDGHFIIMGGYNYQREELQNVWALDITDKGAVWIEKPSMPMPCCAFSIAKIDGRVFVCGGRFITPSQSVQIFDRQVWRKSSNMPIIRERTPAAVIPMQFARFLS